jgi:hypothetical protein
MTRLAGVAQLVEQLIRNQQVVGSSPTAGSKIPKKLAILTTQSSPISSAGQHIGNNHAP